MSLRLTGGALRGRAIRTPIGVSVRPTASRVREAIFSVVGQRLDGLRLLDLCAGAGALALEALSRGAAFALCVDRDRRNTKLIEANARALGFGPDRCAVRADEAQRVIAPLAAAGTPWGGVFLDPPYGDGTAAAVLAEIEAFPSLVAAQGFIVVEAAFRDVLPGRIEGFGSDPLRRYGETVLRVYRREAA
jgi:16S rRNA (guanine(966)-N(2))-methyltransferase RsmD